MRKILISMSIILHFSNCANSTFASVSCKKRGYLSGTVKATVAALLLAAELTADHAKKTFNYHLEEIVQWWWWFGETIFHVTKLFL